MVSWSGLTGPSLMNSSETFHNKLYASVEELQADLDEWLHHYNYDRPHRGYRNMGRRPIETIENGKVIKEQLTTEQAA